MKRVEEESLPSFSWFQKDEGAEQNRSSKDSLQPRAGALLKTGVLSLFLHSALVVLLILSVRSGTTKDSLSVYRVTLQPFSPAEKRNQKPLLPRASTKDCLCRCPFCEKLKLETKKLSHWKR